LAITTSLEVTEGVAILRCRGIVSQGNEGERLAQEISQLVQHHRRLLVHLGGVENMDSADLKPVVLVGLLARSVGTDIRFAHLPRRLELLRSLINMLEQSGVYDTLEEALSAFTEAGETSGPTELAQSVESPGQRLGRAGELPTN
jgi:anti-anti-sigma regulatory factor